MKNIHMKRNQFLITLFTLSITLSYAQYHEPIGRYYEDSKDITLGLDTTIISLIVGAVLLFIGWMIRSSKNDSMSSVGALFVIVGFISIIPFVSIIFSALGLLYNIGVILVFVIGGIALLRERFKKNKPSLKSISLDQDNRDTGVDKVMEVIEEPEDDSEEKKERDKEISIKHLERDFKMFISLSGDDKLGYGGKTALLTCLDFKDDYPNDYRIWFLEGKIHYSSEDYKTAKKCFKKALRLNKNCGASEYLEKIKNTK